MSSKRGTGLQVIGVGASAGGLDALTRFFGATDEDVTAAFVVVQHFDPTQKSIMASLLDRETALEVVEARNAEKLRSGTVFTTPPGKYATVHDGHIVLEEPTEARYHRSPIDHLFRSLAEGYGETSIGVVLSGTGSDGSRGLSTIKMAGGSTFVQAPTDAEFDGMPRAAIEIGATDVVAPAEDLPNRLRQRLGLVQRTPPPSEDREDGLAEVLDVLSICNGFDFFEYKPTTLGRRVRRRMARSSVGRMSDYVRLLRKTPEERETLINDLLIGVTSFFRDPEAWKEFSALAITPAIECVDEGTTLRAWTAGCASGEEAYTLAMAILEVAEKIGKTIGLQVFGTDLNANAIEVARSGVYSAAAVSALDADLVSQWFTKEGSQVRVIPQLREKVVFSTQNAVNDPPFSSLHFITCRNLLIYLDIQAQDRLMDLFHFSLAEKGCLMLGSAETAGRARDAFETISAKHRIYRSRGGRTRLLHARTASKLESDIEPVSASPTAILADSATNAMISRFVPPAVLLKENFDIVGMHGDLGDYIRFRRSGLTSSILNMVADPYQVQVWKAVQSARRDNAPAEAAVNPVEPGQPRVTILAEPVKTESRREYLVYFMKDAPCLPSDRVQEHMASEIAFASEEEPETLESYRREVIMLRAELQSVIERSERSNEELQAANEEVMSANEELQSSNEELETSREELQSLNQELKSINVALEEKVDELEATNDDLANLIRSTDIATIFLDTRLEIRRFSGRAMDLLSIRDKDIGRPIRELSLKVDDPTLLQDLETVLANLETVEVEVSGADRSYLRRATPYRTRLNVIQGAIVTYSDVTSLTTAMARLELQARRQEVVAGLGELALASQDDTMLFDRAAKGLLDSLGASFTAVQRHDSETGSFCLVAGAGRAARFKGTLTANESRNELGHTFRQHGPLVTTDATAEPRFAPSTLLEDSGVRSGVCAKIGPMLQPWGVLEAWWEEDGKPAGEIVHYITTVAGVLSLAIAQAESRSLRENERAVLQSLIDGLPILFGVVDEETRFELFNSAFEKIGWLPDEIKGAPVAQVLGSEAAKIAAATVKEPSGQPAKSREIQIRFPGDRQRTHLLYCVPRVNRRRTIGAYLAVLDIHERKMWEERNKIISAELDHRVKNILALVSTITRMTARYTTNFDDFQDILSNRIDSLARTHARLAAKSWSGMELRRLIEDELAAYAPPEAPRYSLSGPEVFLGMRATQSMSMVLHELTTNAVKYGSLAYPNGRLGVSWTMDDEQLEIHWTETGVGRLEEPTRKGFGSTVIENAIKRQLFGELVRTFGDDGMSYALTIPAPSLEERGRENV